MSNNVLVVSTVEYPESVLRGLLGETDAVRVVVPVVRQSILDWLANDEAAFSHAVETAERIADRLPGDALDARGGEADVRLAIEDALATFPADEIVIAVHPSQQEGRIESLATDTAPTRSVNGVPVRYVVIPE